MAEVEFKGLDKIIAKLDKMQDTSTIVSAMQDACDLVEGSAKGKAPKDTGALKRSITNRIEVIGNEVSGIVFTPLEWAPYIEYGTGMYAENGNGTSGYWVYVGDKDYDPDRKKSHKRYTLQEAKQIVAIMRSKGLKAYYTNGQHPQPFMRPALKENEQNIKKKLKEGIMSD